MKARPNKSLHRTPTRNTTHSNMLHFVVRVGAGELRALGAEGPRRHVRCHLVLAACLSLAAISCSDNALLFRHHVERAVERLAEARNKRTEPISYTPETSGTKPYWLILFPNRPTTVADLVRHGMPPPTAKEIFSQLAYVSVGKGEMVVVWQDGERLSFQGYHGSTPVTIDDLIVIRGTGEVLLNLQKLPTGEYRLSVPK